MKNCHALYKVMGINVDRVGVCIAKPTLGMLFKQQESSSRPEGDKLKQGDRATALPRSGLPSARCPTNVAEAAMQQTAAGHGETIPTKDAKQRLLSSFFRSDRGCIHYLFFHPVLLLKR